MAEQSRAYVYDCCGATKTSPHLNLLTTYEKEISPSTKKNHSNRVMVYRVCQLIHGKALLLDSYVVKKFLRSVQHEAGNLGPKLQPRGGFFGP